MRYGLLFAVLGCGVLVSFARGEISVARSERGAVVTIDGELFAEYLTRAGASPAIWPIVGPTGEPMTRAYPLEEGVAGETDDHPHHQSLWFTHDRVGGVDFWKANTGPVIPTSDVGATRGAHIAHRAFTHLGSDGRTARVATRNDWMDGSRRVLRDERVVVFGRRAGGDRWIDFTITLQANDGDVTFGDTKEGTFAVRVADSMRVEAEQGGRFENSAGQVNGEAWGMPARWVDYTGPVRGQTVGIAIMSHPTSFRPEPRWHVREYGLFAANPFGEEDFPDAEGAEQGAVTIKRGDELTLRYRVLLHRGETEEADMEAAFEEFARREEGR